MRWSGCITTFGQSYVTLQLLVSISPPNSNGWERTDAHEANVFVPLQLIVGESPSSNCWGEWMPMAKWYVWCCCCCCCCCCCWRLTFQHSPMAKKNWMFVGRSDVRLCELWRPSLHPQMVARKWCPYDKHVCIDAARGGHRSILQWVRENGCPLDVRTCTATA